MKQRNRFIVISIVILALVLFGYWLINKPDHQSDSSLSFSKPMKIISSVFNSNELIPSKYTCDGANINPPLQIVSVPDNAKSLALVMDDPDSATGTWLHWTLWNIDPRTKFIKEDSIPKEAQQGITSFKQIGYGGPCPGSGLRHYYFKLYALSAAPNLSEGATLGELQNFIDSHTIAVAELIGLYTRQR